MNITDQAKRYMLDISGNGEEKAFHLFSTDTCCGKGVGLKTMPKKSIDYVEVEGLSFKFERDMLMQLHGMVIDTELVNGQETLSIITK